MKIEYNSNKAVFEDVSYQVSSFEGTPIMETITAEEQRDFVQSGYGSVSDLISYNMEAYRDWQADY